MKPWLKWKIIKGINMETPETPINQENGNDEEKMFYYTSNDGAMILTEHDGNPQPEILVKNDDEYDNFHDYITSCGYSDFGNISHDGMYEFSIYYYNGDKKPEYKYVIVLDFEDLITIFVPNLNDLITTLARIKPLTDFAVGCATNSLLDSIDYNLKKNLH